MKATMEHNIDSEKAKETAIRFLEQHHNIIEIKNTILDDGIWTVMALLSSTNDPTRKVRVDANTGKIIDWSK